MPSGSAHSARGTTSSAVPASSGAASPGSRSSTPRTRPRQHRRACPRSEIDKGRRDPRSGVMPSRGLPRAPQGVVSPPMTRMLAPYSKGRYWALRPGVSACHRRDALALIGPVGIVEEDQRMRRTTVARRTGSAGYRANGAVVPGGPSTNTRSMGASRCKPARSYQGQVPPRQARCPRAGRRRRDNVSVRPMAASCRRAAISVAWRDARATTGGRCRRAGERAPMATCWTRRRPRRPPAGDPARPRPELAEDVRRCGATACLRDRDGPRHHVTDRIERRQLIEQVLCCRLPTRSWRTSRALRALRARTSRWRALTLARRIMRPTTSRTAVVAAAGPTTMAASLDTPPAPSTSVATARPAAMGTASMSAPAADAVVHAAAIVTGPECGLMGQGMLWPPVWLPA